VHRRAVGDPAATWHVLARRARELDAQDVAERGVEVVEALRAGRGGEGRAVRGRRKAVRVGWGLR
jgi:hypothetical protein